MSDNSEVPVADLSRAPIPTQRTLNYRKNLAVQLWKFAAFDLTILRMVHKHPTPAVVVIPPPQGEH